MHKASEPQHVMLLWIHCMENTAVGFTQWSNSAIKSFHHTIKCGLHNKLHSVVLICFWRGYECPTTRTTVGCTCSHTALPAWSLLTQSIYFHSDQQKQQELEIFSTRKAVERMQHQDRLENSTLCYITSTGTDSKRKNAVVSCPAKCPCVFMRVHTWFSLQLINI